MTNGPEPSGVPGSGGSMGIKSANKFMKTPSKPQTANLFLKATQIKHLLAFQVTPKHFYHSSYSPYKYSILQMYSYLMACLIVVQ